ncbi:uncharacterized protein LOC125235750 [Leguminivora glycinivorella]|uniref:uncharacterized protein LOC125235750 n=1 Tax=Leguminivora glycinivorella TaxID=1035111 RepID=UPI00200C22F6|nr:uncharacterized protein LOC125235750 [Leguminivora glycinivorella]
MVSTLVYKFCLIIVMLKCCRADENLAWGDNITKLYEIVSGAIKNGTDLKAPHLTRRFFVNDSVYEIHLKKLKNVNGIKIHNIAITRSGPDINSTIYINNPLEAKFPHPFMSLEEFKNTLVEHQLKDREAFIRSKNKALHDKMWADIKATAKLKTTRTQKTRQRVKLAMKIDKNTNNKSKPMKVQQHKILNTPKLNTSHVNNHITKANIVNTSTTVHFRAKLLYIENPTEQSSHINEADENSTSPKNKNVTKQTALQSSEDEEKQLATVEETKDNAEHVSSANDGETIKEELADSTDNPDNRELSTNDENATNLAGEMTVIDEDAKKGVAEMELRNINEDESKDAMTEELTTETTTTTKATPSTTRERWSRPRVLMGTQPESTTTTS